MANESSLKPFLIDSRIIQRNIKAGRIDRDVFEKHINTLPDLADNCRDIGEEIYSAERTKIAVTGDYVRNENDE